MYVACSRATSASGLYLIGTSFKPTKPLSPTESIAIELERQSGVKLKTKFDELIERTSSYRFQLIFHNVQSLNAHIDQIKNDKTYLSTDFLLFAETWSTATQSFSIPGFEEVSRVDVEGAIARANGSICFAQSSLIEQNPVSNKIEQLIIDDNNHKMSISAFIFNDLLIASVYRSPRFFAEKAKVEIAKLLEIRTSSKIIAGDFNSHFDDEENTFTELFNQYGLFHSLKGRLNSTTKYKSFIDNIFTNIVDHEFGRYISFTSYHDPLFMQFNV